MLNPVDLRMVQWDMWRYGQNRETSISLGSIGGNDDRRSTMHSANFKIFLTPTHGFRLHGVMGLQSVGVDDLGWGLRCVWELSGVS